MPYNAVTGHFVADLTLTLCIAAVGTAWPLLGSPRNGQAALLPLSKTSIILGKILIAALNVDDF